MRIPSVTRLPFVTLALVVALLAIAPASAASANSGGVYHCTGNAPSSTLDYDKPFNTSANGHYIVKSRSFTVTPCVHSGTDWDSQDSSDPFPLFAVVGGTITAKAIDDEPGKGCYGRYLNLNTTGDTNNTAYAHMSSRLVDLGDHVVSGDLVGYSGDTGWCPDGNHAHVTMTESWNGWYGDNAVYSPRTFLADNGVTWTGSQ